MSYLFIALSYLIGSLNFAYIVAKYKKLDISSSGSGNPGTSNVMRTIGKKYAAIVLIGDVLKGFLPIYLFDENLLLCGFAAVIGHIYPIFYKFNVVIYRDNIIISTYTSQDSLKGTFGEDINLFIRTNNQLLFLLILILAL